MTEILTIETYDPAEEWRNLFRLKPSHKREIVFGFLFRLLVGIVSVVFPVIALMVVGFFNGWQLTPPLIALFGGFVCLSVYFGEHLRSRVYERSISTRIRNAESIASIEEMEETGCRASASDRLPFLQRVDETAKRVIDVTAVLIAVPLLLPQFIIVALAIKATSPGPIFSRTRRLGLRQRVFDAYQFRTMFVAGHPGTLDADAFALRRDPRVTAIGSYLRMSSVHSLPLLFNVLTGDMSLVGPSLLTLDADAEVTKQMAARGLDRHSMRPGMISMAQVSGASIGHEMSKFVATESVYLRNWSLWLDFNLFLVAVRTVLRSANAY
jgi:lipopolysaccharide/colanic/teichoic acid biosynthesis glycosyltransferase